MIHCLQVHQTPTPCITLNFKSHQSPKSEQLESSNPLRHSPLPDCICIVKLVITTSFGSFVSLYIFICAAYPKGFLCIFTHLVSFHLKLKIFCVSAFKNKINSIWQLEILFFFYAAYKNIVSWQTYMELTWKRFYTMELLVIYKDKQKLEET